ncbi:hypothetical protein GCM10009677_27960 [Sphaerisporangium rubeum]|uniref:Uncharacterized protein n=1 Tax=Sphaerisporangium rubeum TaxID=321317 RepID=A0A7X0M5P6_9ACTN|nr:hypothetical protein [Sphaerisporangium rubeum]MBB6472908.1 hypothetical protein [Sphaerisporangium rubeum]
MPPTGTLTGPEAPILRDHATVNWHVIGRLDSLRREVFLACLPPTLRTETMLDLMAIRTRVCSRTGFDEAEIRTLLTHLTTLVTHHPLLSTKVAGLSAELIGRP